MGFEEVSRSIVSTFNVVSVLDAMQILDIIVKDTDDNKYEVYERTNEQLDVDVILKEFYDSFKNANLATVLFNELDIGGEMSSRIEDMKHTSDVKDAPDNYYLQLINYTVDKPKEGNKVSRDDAIKVVASIYVAIDRGNNYTTAGYPPDKFIKEVAGLTCSREDYLATVLALMHNSKSFIKLLKSVIDKESIDLATYYKAYDALYEDTGSRNKEVILDDIEKIKNVSKKVAKVTKKSKEKQKLTDFVKFPSEETSYNILSKSADKFDTGVTTFKKRFGKLLPLLWWIMLIVNLVTTVWVIIIMIMVMTQPLDVMSGGIGGYIAGIPLLGSIAKGIVTIGAKTGYELRYLVQLVVSGIILAVTIRSKKGLTNIRNLGKITTMIYTLLSVIGTVFNVLFIVRSVTCVISARGAELFWATFFKAMNK